MTAIVHAGEVQLSRNFDAYRIAYTREEFNKIVHKIND